MSSINSKQSSDLRHYKFSSEGSNSSQEAEEEVHVLPNLNVKDPAVNRPSSDKNVHGFGFLENSHKIGNKQVEELEAIITRLKTENEILKGKLESFKIFLNMVIHDLKHPLDAL